MGKEKYYQGLDWENLGEPEKNFISALETYVAEGEEKRDKLFIYYNRLCFSLDDDPSRRDDKLRLIFNALIEQLDNAPDGEISSVLYMYTFKDFLEYYSEEPAVQAAIEYHLNNNTLQKLPLVIALGSRRRTV